ncbi:MAG: (2Fe-2S)-binding protein, partial [Gammaproteobacteria bacterium]|nr:(2Fe-2S)-binding protein [Gammaproteobacteria bacterium]
GRAARLLQHRAEPFIDVHPADLPDLGLSEGDLAWVENRHGQYLGRVRAEPGQRPGEVFAPIHWNDQFTAQGCIGRLLAPVTDPVSGQPESKQGAVRLRRFNARWHARLLTRDLARPSGPPLYWSWVPLTHVNAWHLAAEWAFDPLALASVWLRGEPQLVMHDPSSGRYRAARFQGERLMAVLMVEPENRFPGLDWLDGCFEPPALDIDRRRCVLAGRAVDQVDTGPVVCACFQVGQVAIQAAIGEGCTSVEALGNQLRCGTNCGSCVPEIKNLLLRAEAV